MCHQLRAENVFISHAACQILLNAIKKLVEGKRRIVRMCTTHIDLHSSGMKKKIILSKHFGSALYMKCVCRKLCVWFVWLFIRMALSALGEDKNFRYKNVRGINLCFVGH